METRNTRVKIQSRLTAISSRPVEPGKVHKLTPLDQLMGLHSLHIVFYYRDNPLGSSFVLDPMRESLSKVLSMYPHVTGRLIRSEDGNWEVKCNDAGVRVLRAKVETALDEWLRSADSLEERDLTAWDDMPDDPNIWSPFRIQINEFEGGGLAIGLSCSHMSADLTGATILFKSWTDVHHGKSVEDSPIFTKPVLEPRSVPIKNTESINHYVAKSKLTETSSENMATATFRFSNLAMNEQMSKLHDICPNATPFDFLAALFWTKIARIKSTKHGYNCSLAVGVDCRKLLCGKLPNNYLGNAMHFSLLSLEDEVLVKGLKNVVKMVHDHVANLKEEEFWSVLDWLQSRKDDAGKLALPFRMYGPELTCVNLEHMMVSGAKPGSGDRGLMYEVMFEDNVKPLHVSYNVGNADGEGMIVIMPSAEGGLARTVTVALPEREMAVLRQDQDVLGLEPNVILRGELHF